mgnify:CR=1 FL=1
MKKMDIKAVDLSSFMKVLRNVEFFKSMTIGQIEKVLPFVMLFSYDKGEIVCTQGDVGDSFFMIREGCVDVSIKSGFFRRKKVIATLGPREFFGEMSLLEGVQRSADVFAKEDTQLLSISSGGLLLKIRRDPTFALEMLQSFSGRLRLANERLSKEVQKGNASESDISL